jgi:hypothetical protein
MRASNLVRGKKFQSLPKPTSPLLLLVQLQIQRVQGSFHGDKSGRIVKLPTQLRRIPKLRISEAIPALPHYPFMVHTGKNLTW